MLISNILDLFHNFYLQTYIKFCVFHICVIEKCTKVVSYHTPWNNSALIFNNLKRHLKTYLRFIQNTKEFCSKRKCILSKTSKSFLLNVLAFWNRRKTDRKKQEKTMQYL